MKSSVCLVVLGVLGVLLQDASSMKHSLKYFQTASSQVPNFPEFVSVGLVDDVPMVHYDSDTKRAVPKQDWMKEATEGDPQYWEGETQVCLVWQHDFKGNIETMKRRLNQTGGTHIFQWMYGCEWDDETEEVNGFEQFGFDGEDFIVFDLKTLTWIAPRQEAFVTKLKWERDEGLKAHNKNYFTQECPMWLKRYVRYGKDTLMRTVPPSISLLQKSSSSPVTCHATGFFPERASLFWTKDGDVFYEGVDLGETLPNNDETFQTSAELDVSSVPSGDWGRYSCVFRFPGYEDEIITRLDKAVIRTNEKRTVPLIITAAAAVVGVGVAVSAALGFFFYKKNAKRPPTPVSDREVEEELNPTS